eukprot:944499-Pyramimonas_sp.AAC.1
MATRTTAEVRLVLADHPRHRQGQWPAEAVLRDCLPAGTECSGCFDARRRFFDDQLKSLNELRNASRTLNDRFLALRRDRLSGGDQFKSEAK